VNEQPANTEHRAATPLELFFDLVFVVAIAQAAGRLHHGLAAAHVSEAVLSYFMVFFAIWWAWMNFTWFASAYDTDDVAYRLAVFVQLTGALMLAAGVPRAFDQADFALMAAGYVVMRLALVALWLRAGRSDPARRASAHRYALGVTLCQIGWVAWLFIPSEWGLPGFVALVVAELLVPVWAERAALTPWHPGHIAERYGLFTIIVLGESILAASLAIQSAADAGDFTSTVGTIIIGGLLIVFSMWWLYFERPVDDRLASQGTAFIWGYGHYLIFASAAAVGAGLAVAVDFATGHAEIGAFGAGATVAVPVAGYLLGVWALHTGACEEGPIVRFAVPAVALLVLLTPLTGHAVLVTGVLLATLLATKLAMATKLARAT
jgi:low temperature requirement protein LtrA